MLKWFQSALIGLLMGLSSTFVIMSISIYSKDSFITGSELLQQVVLGAGLGIVIGLFSLLFTLEKPFLMLLGIHYLLINILVFLFGSWGEWFDPNVLSVFGLILITMITYIIIWSILLVLGKRDVSEINLLLEERTK